MSAAGSVDSKGTYVFEVEGRATEQRLSKQSPYWSVKNGDDTMVALWNPTENAEDITVTMRYAGGSGVYHLPIHLAPFGTAEVDVKDLIANRSRDEEGNLLPQNLQEGPEVSASWSSSNTSVASVDSNGNVTGGNNPGNVTVTATAADLPEEGDYSGYNPTCESLQSYINFTGSATVSVGDLSPVITSVDPSVWQP